VIHRRALVAGFLLAACHRTLPTSAPLPADLVPAPAESLGFDRAALRRVVAYVASQVDSAYPGAVVAVGRHGRLALLAAVGHYGVDDPRPVEPTTIYDLASLTKVVGLTTACMMLVDEGRLELDAPVRAYLPEFRGSGKDSVTIRHLLTHSSGLPAWRSLFREAKDGRGARALVDTTPLDTTPGARFVYSDLGAIVLDQVVERVTGLPMDRYLEARVFRPLGMTATRFRPPAGWRPRIAPTERDTAFRQRVLRGEVHDENAGRLGGVSGHAGLFSNAVDLARFAAWLLDAVRPAPCSALCLSPGTAREFTRRQGLPPGSTRALGWDTPSDSGYSSAGTKLSRRSFGHTGFTGTSIWIDPDRDLFVILLTNRVHPTRANTRILEVRAAVADLVVDALQAEEGGSGRERTEEDGRRR
jgi:CubicO group peptidase (beta-lactamase class C family)